MVFSSIVFLYIFLPLTLLAYLLVGKGLRNVFLLIVSLTFYAWGEGFFVLLMLLSIVSNYLFGLAIDFYRHRESPGRFVLVIAILFNLGLLVFFKYTNLLIVDLNFALVKMGFSPIELAPIHLPIGISFFTFQALSYVIDVYRGRAVVQKKFVNIGLYISLFPQLIAGPIVRYQDIALQIEGRIENFENFFCGVQRFIVGLSKKVLLANVLGRSVDYIFSLPPGDLSPFLAWLGAVSYTLQIYFDFSGYSDMAIGLGRMFGFHFLENFNYPYISRSIRDFWQRWHISLSTWFRDYLYIPLGGSRSGAFKTYRNLLIVFLLCGFWHGANWTFVVWGAYHGCFLILERLIKVKVDSCLFLRFIQHVYVCFVVIVGWVFFRAETIGHAFAYLHAMVDWTRPPLFNSQIFIHMNSEFYFVLIVSFFCAGPLSLLIRSRMVTCFAEKAMFSAGRFSLLLKKSFFVMKYAGLLFMLLYSVANILRGAYNPFLYFRF